MKYSPKFSWTFYINWPIKTHNITYMIYHKKINRKSSQPCIPLLVNPNAAAKSEDVTSFPPEHFPSASFLDSWLSSAASEGDTTSLIRTRGNLRGHTKQPDPQCCSIHLWIWWSPAQPIGWTGKGWSRTGRCRRCWAEHGRRSGTLPCAGSGTTLCQQTRARCRKLQLFLPGRRRSLQCKLGIAWRAAPTSALPNK